MYKIGVIGERDSVLGFKAVGLDVHPCSQSDEAKKILHQLAKDEYAIIYITEGLAADMVKDIDKYKDSRLPAIIPIPGKEGASGKEWTVSESPSSVLWAQTYYLEVKSR